MRRVHVDNLITGFLSWWSVAECCPEIILLWMQLPESDNSKVLRIWEGTQNWRFVWKHCIYFYEESADLCKSDKVWRGEFQSTHLNVLSLYPFSQNHLDSIRRKPICTNSMLMMWFIKVGMETQVYTSCVLMCILNIRDICKLWSKANVTSIPRDQS